MPSLDNSVHIALERKILPKMRVGIQIAVIAAVLLIFFTPRAGVLRNQVNERISWILAAVGVTLLACAAIVVFYLPAYYRRLSRMLREESPTLMRVTLVEGGKGAADLVAELRPHESQATDPAEIEVPVLERVNVPPHFPAQVYGAQEDGPIVIETVHGILWPVPDERQQKMEDLFHVRS